MSATTTTTTAAYQSVFPIGDTDPQNLPVADVDEAARFYVDSMGFTVQSRADSPEKAVTLQRDGITLRLCENGGDPEQASCYIGVSDVETAFRELQEKGAEVSEVRPQDHDGKNYRVFFVRAPDGLCFCLGQPA